MQAADRLLMTASPPPLTAGQAEDIARRVFGVAAKATALPGERDRNFRLVGDDGREHVLKVSSAAEDRGVTELQTKALQHIAARDPDLPVPRVVLAQSGAAMTVLRVGEAMHAVRLLTYLSGLLLHRTASSAHQQRALGRVLARIDLALRDFTHPAARRELIWDLSQASRLRDLLPSIADTERRALAARSLDGFEEHAAPRLPQLRHQAIHGDLNPHNVVVDPADPSCVVGVLDLGDMVDAPLVNDVAIAAAYQLSDTTSPLDGAAELVAAYHGVLALAPGEVDILFDLVAARLVATVAITEWRAALQPENREYILRNHPIALAGLRRLAGVGRDAAARALRRACGMDRA